MKKAQNTLGIVAGGGALPRAVIETARAQKRPVFVLALKGQAEPDILSHADGDWIRLGQIGKGAKLFKKAGVKDVVFIGSVRRPSVAEVRPDWKTFLVLLRVGFRLMGDDGLLKIVLGETEKLGFHVVGVHTLMPELMARSGVYGRFKPDKQDELDIRQGFQVAKLLGQADVGQAVIVQKGLVLSVEGIEGTAALIQRTAALKRKGGGGVLVKVAKPQQDRRVDLPTIGPKTIQAIYDAGFKGIAVEEKSALMVDVDEMIRLADKLGVFVVGVAC